MALEARDAEFIAVFDVEVEGEVFLLTRGPLPLQSEPGTADEIISKKAARTPYVRHPRLRSLLWGTDSHHVRWHAETRVAHDFVTSRGTRVRAELFAFEVLVWGDRRHALIAVHGVLLDGNDDPLSSLIELADIDPGHGSATRDVYQAFIGERFSINPDRRRARMSYLVRDPRAVFSAFSDRTKNPTDLWLWYLGTCQLPQRIGVPAEISSEVAASAVAINESWRCSVMRDGVVHLGQPGHEGRMPSNDEVERRLIRFRTLELDLILLAEMQNVTADLIEQDLTRLYIDCKDSSQYTATASKLVQDFHEMYWGERALERGPGQEILRRSRLAMNLAERATSLGEQVSAVEGSIQRRLSAQTNAALGLIAVVGLPASVAFAVWQTTSPTELRSAIWPLVGALAASALALLILPGLRSLFTELLPSGWRRR